MRTKKVNVFQFLETEKKILSAMRVMGTSLSSEIFRHAKVARTSGLHALSKLQLRGLVQSSSFGKRKVWSLVGEETLSEEISNAGSLFGLEHIKISTPGFTILSGKEMILKKYWELLRSIPRGGRFSGIQTTESVLSNIKKIGLEEIHVMNNYVSDQKFVVAAVLEEDSQPRVMKQYGRKWLEGFKERMAATTFVPKSYFSFNAELVIFGSKVLITNWDDETSLLIKNKEVVHMLKSLFQFMHDNGRRLNHHEIAEMLLSRNK